MFVALAALFAALLPLVGCGDGDGAPELEVTPASVKIAKGLKVTVTAKVDGRAASSAVSWRSSDPNIATVVERAGGAAEITGVNAGEARITVSLEESSVEVVAVVGQAVVESIAITPAATGSLPVGLTQQYTATGTFSDTTSADLTAMVTWSASDAARLELSNADGSRGLATARAPGDVAITATLDGVTGNATATVVAVTLQSIAVTPATSSPIVGRTQQLIATGTFNDGSTLDLTTQVSWTSSDETRATISNVDGSRGAVLGVGAGLATLTATMGAITGTSTVDVIGITSIAVTPATADLDIGATQAFTAVATLSTGATLDVTPTAVWTSSNTGAATVSNTDGTRGVVTAVASGSATITATEAGTAGTATVTVIVSVVSIAITPVGDLARGTSRQLIATATLSDATTVDVTAQATWASSDAAALAVGDAAATKGLATALTTAGATVTATLGSISGSLAIAGCKVLINEVQVAGAVGTANAPANEWVEIASGCTATQDLAGLRLIYRSAANANFDFLNLDLTGAIAPNEYKFYVHIALASTYPNASGTFAAAPTGQLASAAGGVALRIGVAGAIVDSLGYGIGVTNGLVEGISATVSAGGSSMARIPDKVDTDVNSADFATRATPSAGDANL